MKIYHQGIGSRYGQWTQVGPVFRVRVGIRPVKFAVWECVCGNRCASRLDHIRAGRSVKCEECRLRASAERLGSLHRTHGMAGVPEYFVWKGMHRRCGSQTCSRFHHYGGRGIFVCERWSGPDGFKNFHDDMGDRPSDKHEIDRIDNDGPYSPDNCRWATASQNARNKRTSRYVVVSGVSRHLCDVAEEYGIHPATLMYRLDDMGMSVEDALRVPVLDSRECASFASKSRRHGVEAMRRGLIE